MKYAYYNENNPDAVLWLRQLIKDHIIMDGEVDDRSIIDVQPNDLGGFRRCHFFAGIGGWDYALQLAGWPADRPVWTGSCPCQSFSQAGKQKGFADPRHLWPHWLRLVAECRPANLFGEQVAAAIGHGWLDLVGTDLERQDYAFGAAILGAHSADAFHKRDRLYFVANRHSERRDRQPVRLQPRRSRQARIEIAGGGATVRMAHHYRIRQQRPQASAEGNPSRIAELGDSGAISPMADLQHQGRHHRRNLKRGRNYHYHGRDAEAGSQRNLGRLQPNPSPNGGMGHAELCGRKSQPNRSTAGIQRALADKGESLQSIGVSSPSFNVWSNAEWVFCKDGKYRAVKPGIHPLANGLPRGMVHRGDPLTQEQANQTQEARKMRIIGYGNAIVPQTAALFIRAFMDTETP